MTGIPAIARPSAALLDSALVRKGQLDSRVLATRPSRRRDQRAIDRHERWDPGRAANNISRLRRIEADYEAGRRCDRPSEIEDKS